MVELSEKEKSLINNGKEFLMQDNIKGFWDYLFTTDNTRYEYSDASVNIIKLFQEVGIDIFKGSTSLDFPTEIVVDHLILPSHITSISGDTVVVGKCFEIVNNNIQLNPKCFSFYHLDQLILPNIQRLPNDVFYAATIDKLTIPDSCIEFGYDCFNRFKGTCYLPSTLEKIDHAMGEIIGTIYIPATAPVLETDFQGKDKLILI